MKIVKVIVDELPESCIECGYLFGSYGNNYYCVIVGKCTDDDADKPDWCPLVESEDT